MSGFVLWACGVWAQSFMAGCPRLLRKRLKRPHLFYNQTLIRKLVSCLFVFFSSPLDACASHQTSVGMCFCYIRDSLPVAVGGAGYAMRCSLAMVWCDEPRIKRDAGCLQSATHATLEGHIRTCNCCCCCCSRLFWSRSLSSAA